MNNKNDLQSKSDSGFFFALLFSVIGLVLAGFALSFIPSTLDELFIKNNFIPDISNFVPETAEKIQYMFLTVMFPVLFFVFSLLFKSKAIFINKKVYNILSFLCPAVITVIIFLSYSHIKNYSDALLKTRSPYLSAALTAAAFLFVWASIFAYNKLNNKYKKAANILLGIFAACAVAYSSWIFIFNNYYVLDESYLSHHFDAYFYPVFRLNNGQTPLIDFNSIYGLYPYLLLPLTKLFGSLSMFSFSCSAALLMLIANASIMVTLFINCKNKVIASVATIAACFCAGLFSITSADSFYLQYYPHRYIFPALMLAFSSLWLWCKSPVIKKILSVIIFILPSFALLWNLDTGVVVLAMYLALKLYLVMWENKKGFVKKGSLLFLHTGFQLLLFLIVTAIFTFIYSGNIVNPLEAIFGASVFYGNGFLMVNMPLWQPWIILIAIYGIALAKGISNMAVLKFEQTNENKERYAVYFLIAVCGLGVFVYYQGRSLDDVFLSVIWPGIILAALFWQEHLEKYKLVSKSLTDKALEIIKMSGLSVLIILFAAFFCFDAVDSRIAPIIKSKPEKAIVQKSVAQREAFTKEIYERTGSMPALLLHHSSYYNMQLNQSDIPAVPERVDWFSYDQCRDIMDFLEQNRRAFIIEDKDLELFLKADSKRFTQLIESGYSLNERRGNLCFFSLKEKSEANVKIEPVVWKTQDMIISGADDGKPWCLYNYGKLSIYNLNTYPIEVKLSISAFTKSGVSKNLLFNLSDGTSFSIPFNSNNELDYTETFTINPGFLSIEINGDGKKFDTQNGMSNFGINELAIS